MHNLQPPPAPPSAAPVLCLIGAPSVRLWSHRTDERLLLQFSRLGIRRTIPEAEIAACPGPLILVRADAVLDQPLAAALSERPDLVLLGNGPDGELPVAAHVRSGQACAAADLLREPRVADPPQGLHPRSPAELGRAFWQQLRKREVPYAHVVDHRNRAEVEWRIFMGTYKGATDIVTKRLWPVPAFYVTRTLAAAGVSPNLVTAVAGALVLVAFVLFLYGHYIPGLVAAWLMTFLDTVDGKLARTTLTASKWGDVFDHGIDIVHPPFWYFAWASGLSAWGFVWPGATLSWTVGIILAGYILQRLIEGIALKFLKMDIHIWRPIDTSFREITARRNPNLVILTASMLLGRPDLGLIAVALWIALCLVLHAVQLAQALAAKSRRGQIVSWMQDQPSSG